MAKLVTVASFTSPWEAHLAKGRLEAEGIPAFIAHEHHVWANWMYSQALGGVKIRVFAEDATAAEQIIGSHLRGEYEPILEEKFPHLERNKCPRCGSAEFRSRIPLGKLLLVILTLGLFSIIFPVRREYHTCRRCAHQWRY